VAPAVADMSDDQRVVEEVHRDAGRPHALEPRLLLGTLPDLEVGEHDAGDHAVDVGAQVAVDLVGPGQRLLLAGLVEVVGDEVDREPARDLARRVAAHAVGDDRQPLAVRQRDRILVMIALAPDCAPPNQPPLARRGAEPPAYSHPPAAGPGPPAGPGRGKPAIPAATRARTLPVDSDRLAFHPSGTMWGYAQGNATIVGIV